MDIYEAFTRARETLENLSGKSFFGGGCMKYSWVLGSLDGAKEDDTTDFHTHSGWITSDKYPDEEYKIVIMIIGRKKT